MAVKNGTKGPLIFNPNIEVVVKVDGLGLAMNCSQAIIKNCQIIFSFIPHLNTTYELQYITLRKGAHYLA